MGTAAGCGVPAFFCTCPACEEARANPAARRGDCGVMIEHHQRLIIDTPPDLRQQFIRENVHEIDRLLYTHAHFDHLGGLGELEYMVRLGKNIQLPTYGSPATFETIHREFGYMEDCLDIHKVLPFDEWDYDGVHYTALPVTHAPGTYGWLIETPQTSLFYAPDTGPLPEATAEHVRGVDIMTMDATYWKKNWSPQNHHSIQECIEEAFLLDAGTLYLTHLCMHYDEPITLTQLNEYLAQYEGRVKPAMDGLKLTL